MKMPNKKKKQSIQFNSKVNVNSQCKLKKGNGFLYNQKKKKKVVCDKKQCAF